MEAAGKYLLFDTPPDLRDQVLTFGVARVDAVFITHGHADHIFGFDDLRRFSEIQQEHLPVHAAPDTLALLRSKFDYVEKASHSFGGVPRVVFREMTGPIALGPVRVTPVPVWHGEERVYGFRVEAEGVAAVYIPDCSAIPEDSFPLIGSPDVMILDALREEPHPTHFSLAESLAALRRIGAGQAFITHLTHGLEHAAVQARLPERVAVPYDGLRVTVRKNAIPH